MSQKETQERCIWPGADPLLIEYHDTEWGVPLHDDRKLFEFLVLDAAQAGLSWLTILKKRQNYRKAFENFDFNNGFVNVIAYPGAHENMSLKMLIGSYYNEDQPADEQDFHYIKAQNVDVNGYVNGNRLLRILGGSNDTTNVTFSVGFYSERGHIEQVKIKEIKVSFRPYSQ